jgi:cell wall-associated NlpC family hydrolase
MWFGTTSAPRQKDRPLRNNTRIAAAVAVVLAGVLGVGSAAVADSGYPSQSQVNQARQQVGQARSSLASARGAYAAAESAASRAEQAAEIAAERYNEAMWRLGLAQAATRRAVEHAEAMHQQVAQQRVGIADLVVRSYQQGAELDGLTAFLNSGGPVQALENAGVVNMAGDSMKAQYDRFVALSSAADAAQQRASAAQAQQQKVAAAAKTARSAASAAAGRSQALLHKAAAHRDVLVKALATAEHTSVALASQRQAALERIAREKAAAQRRAEEARQAAQAAAQASSGGSSGGSSAGTSAPPSQLPAPSNRAVAAVIAYAKAQLGKPYRWAAAGPDSFDCSGLTLMAWRQGGIDLVHYSGSQYAAGTPIPVSAARPGDLYFWSYNGRPSGIHHVALALGNGEFIEAPHTGAFVRYNNVSNWYPDFAVRL